MEIRKELIGLDIVIREAKNKDLVGVKGRIVDESKNSILIQDGKKKRLLKNQIKLMLIQGKDIDGKDLLSRPEERRFVD